jgi:hypothetical protein
MKTKLLFVILFFSSIAFGQEKEKQHRNILAIEPLSFINRFKVKYERVLNDKFTTGVFISYYPEFYSWNKITGTEVSPFLRYYFSKDPPDGFYVQAKALLGFYKSNIPYIDLDSSYGCGGFIGNSGTCYKGTELKNMNFWGIGIGGDIGMQSLEGKHERITIDWSIGAKYYPLPASIPQQITVDGELYNLDTSMKTKGFFTKLPWNRKGGIGNWHGITGKGFLISLNFSVGYKI